MSKDFDDDTFLLLSLKNDNEIAYSHLIDKHYHSLFMYALNLSNNRSLAEDIVQNVYLKIWEKRKNLNLNFPVKKLLFKAVYNDFINEYNKKKSVGLLERKYVETVNLLVEKNDDSILNEKLEFIKKEIQKLPPKCQKTFLLSKQEGLTNKEISEYLNISVNTVENHISKAFSILREKTKDVSKSILFFLFGRLTK